MQLMRELSQLEIESGIIHKNQRVGTELTQQSLRLTQVTEDYRQLAQHLAEAHHIHLIIMQVRVSARLLSHKVTAEKTDIGGCVYLPERFYNISRVEVSGRLPRNNHIFHVSLISYICLSAVFYNINGTEAFLIYYEESFLVFYDNDMVDWFNRHLLYK